MTYATQIAPTSADASDLRVITGVDRKAISDPKGSLTDAASWSARTYLFQTSDTAAPTEIYWPWLIKTDHIPNPLGKYYLYFSTDHHGGSGGIYMAYAESPLGPFTQYGQVYVDLSTPSIGQTETPSVIWDDYIGKYRMYYQQTAAKYGAGNATSAIGAQSTLSATSADGLSWVKDPAFILDMPFTSAVHGDGHTGYFLPFRTRNGLFAYSLAGSTEGADFNLWTCTGTPADWVSDWRTLGYSRHITQGAPLGGRMIAWNHSFIVESGGLSYIVARLSSGASGADLNDDRIVVAQISPNYRNIMTRPQIIWAGEDAWEGTNLRAITPFVEGGILYVYYNVFGKFGVFSHVL